MEELSLALGKQQFVLVRETLSLRDFYSFWFQDEECLDIIKVCKNAFLKSGNYSKGMYLHGFIKKVSNVLDIEWRSVKNQVQLLQIELCI